MKSGYSSHLKAKVTPQTQPVVGKTQVENNAGGFVFQISPEDQFKRFLILGSEGGTYYASEHKMTVDNAKNAIAFIKSNGKKAVDIIVEVSDAGRAPKNDPAIFALALAATYGDAATKTLAYQAIPKVCRIATHLFHFCQAIQDLRGWSRGLRKGVANFYGVKTTDDNAYQMVKYRQRDGWTHKDVIKLAHPSFPKSMKDVHALIKYALGKEVSMKSLPSMVQNFEEVQKMKTSKEVVDMIKKDKRMTWEMLPTDMLKSPDVWESLLPNMPLTAMLRNLAKMTSIGVLKGNNEYVKHVTKTLTDADLLKKARMHPLQVLVALKTYGSGQGMRGSLTWSPVAQITDALDDAVMLAFGNIESTGKRYLLGLDVSGSMTMGSVCGSPLTPREGAACMALATAKAEQDYTIMAFSTGFVPLKITKKSTFNDTLAITEHLPFDGTDCSLPMVYAMKHKLEIDTFCVYTDNETYAGNIHPFQALKQYRKQSGINAKLVVVGMTATEFSIADPSDAGMLDVVGFDTAAPNLIAEFSK